MKIDYKTHFKQKYKQSKNLLKKQQHKRYKASVAASVFAGFLGTVALINNSSTHAAPGGNFQPLELPDLPMQSSIVRDNIQQALPSWQQVQIANGDSMSLIAKRENIPAGDIFAVMKSKAAAKQLRNIRAGKKIRYQLDDDGKLSALEYDISDSKRLEVTRTEDATFNSSIVKREFQTTQTQTYGTIKSSMYKAALDAGLSDNLIMELANIFGYDIDFTLDVRTGDSFQVVWEEKYRDGEKVKDGNILAASFINKNRVITALRYDFEDGSNGYYSPKGKSLKKAFLRSPVHFTRISSRFNPNRLHPIFKTVRPHRGVDYAARTGTPVYSAGDGKVIFRGNKRGYGNVVIVQHGSKYQTLYAHLSKFNRSAKNGSHVKQGQTIGYVGQTGWATGPHLHYEFRVNGVHRNPLTVKLPTAEPLAKQHLADFKTKTSPLLAQLDTLQRTQDLLLAKK